MKTPAFVVVAFMLIGIASAQETNAGASGVNLALVATPLSSYVSGDTRNSALNDGLIPRSSRDNRRGSYGNWPRQGTQWVQYEWTQPISTKEVEVYWWDDRQGVRLPTASRLKFWNGNEFVPVQNAAGLGIAADKFNTTTFDEATTTKLRLEMDGDGEFSTGVLEWRVLDSGKSPDFPPTVSAGVDRDVMLGGKTYLSGKVKLLKPSPSARVTWIPSVSLATARRAFETFGSVGSSTTSSTFRRCSTLFTTWPAVTLPEPSAR